MIVGTPNDLKDSAALAKWVKQKEFAGASIRPRWIYQMPEFAGQILQSNASATAELREGIVTVQDGRFTEIEITDTVDASNTLICPGFIDAHLHLPQFDAIGASGMVLLPWLDQVIFPAEAKWNDLDYATSMIQRVIAQCLSVGTTGICAYATVDHQASMQALTAFRETGFRGVVGQVLMDRFAPEALLRPAQQQIEEASRTVDSFPPGERLSAAVTPRFGISCTPELLAAAGRLSQESGAMVQTHLAETVAECARVAELFDGQRYVDVYDSFGLLSSQCIAGHGIHLSMEDQQQLADRGCLIAHCPTANSFLGSGTMNRASLRSHKIGVVLGSDIGAGYERSMVRVGRAMIDAAMRLDPEVDHETLPSAAQAWHQITAGNADALGWDDAGRIQKDRSADFLVIQPDIPWRDARCPLSTLMFAWDDRWIKQVYLRGELKYDSASGPSP